MSKNRSFRPRGALSFDTNEDGPDTASQPVAVTAPKPSTVKPASKEPRPVLSFGDDGEEGPISIKKKDKKKLGRAAGLPDLPATTQAATSSASTGEYTVEKLAALQRNTLSFNAGSLAQYSGQADVPSHAAASQAAKQELPTIKLAGSFKPAGQSRDDRFTLNPIAVVKPEPVGHAKGADPFARPSANPSKRGSSQGQPGSKAAPGGHAAAQPVPVKVEQGGGGGAGGDADSGDDDDNGVVIPNAEMIRLAKAKRESLRHARLAPDYVPLGGTSKLLASTRGRAGSEAGAEAQDAEAHTSGSGSGSDREAEVEEHMRLKFGISGADRSRARTEGARSAMQATEEEEEEAFASEQLRKAVHRQRGAMQAAARQDMAGGAASGPAAAEDGHGQAAAASTAAMAGILRSRQDAINQQAAAVLQALHDGVAQMAASCKSTQSQLTRTSNNLVGSLSKVDQLEKDIKAASDRYVGAQQARAYIADLVDCLSAKSELVEELEDSLMDLREERATAGRDAMQALEREMLQLAQAAISAATGVLSRGGALPAAQEAAEGAAEACEEDLLDAAAGDADEVDEFGRNVNLGKRREAEQRRRQRAGAISRETQLLAAVAAGEPVNWQADVLNVEEASQAARYDARHAEVMEAAGTVFADAAEEFASLAAVKQRLEDFKLQRPKEYAQTYMHLSTPALFAPYVRLELLTWDPLFADMPAGTAPAPATTSGGAGKAGQLEGAAANGHATSTQARHGVQKGFDKQAWYELLFDFGMGPDPAAVAADDPDAELVPQLVRKLVLPVAAHMLARCWDPTDIRQSQAAAAVVADLCVYVAADEERMADVLNSAVASLEDAVELCSLPAWPPVAVSVSPLAAAVQFRRFRCAMRVLRCIGTFEGLLARPLLASLALGKLVNAQLMPFLRTAGAAVSKQPAMAIALVEAVCLALPAEWFQGAEPQDAGPLIELATNLARSLESNRTQTDRPASLVGRLVKALAHLGQTDASQKLSAAYGLQR